MVSKALLTRRQKSMGPAYRLFYDDPIHLVRGEGVWLFDADGNKYLDMYNNVPHVGHCHPRVVEAICQQASRLNTHTRYLHENVLDLAERLTGKFPNDLDTAMFCCTGTEANELALRIARRCTGGTGIIVTDFAYHGNSQAIYEISTDIIPAEDVPDYVVTVPAPDTYRGAYRDADAGVRYAAHVNDALALLQSRGIKPAAFVIDTIISSSGVVAPPTGYLGAVAEIVRDAGALFVADEVQAGFGRTGSHFWGYEAGGIIPDIVTLGKPMGNGHPLSAVVTRRELVDTFSGYGRYFNTFGGNPVSCAVGMAVLDVLETENLQDNARVVGDRLLAGLRGLVDRHPIAGDARGVGLYLGLELVLDRTTREPAAAAASHVANRMRDHGILISTDGPDHNVLKMKPPICFSEADADRLVATLDAVLAEDAVAAAPTTT